MSNLIKTFKNTEDKLKPEFTSIRHALSAVSPFTLNGNGGLLSVTHCKKSFIPASDHQSWEKNYNWKQMVNKIKTWVQATQLAEETYSSTSKFQNQVLPTCPPNKENLKGQIQITE